MFGIPGVPGSHFSTIPNGCFISLEKIFFHIKIYLVAEESKHFTEVQPPEVFYKKGVLRNFSKFTGKRLCQNLIFNSVI